MMRPPRPVLSFPPPLSLSPGRIKTQIKAKLKLPKTKVLKYPRKKERERERAGRAGGSDNADFRLSTTVLGTRVTGSWSWSWSLVLVGDISPHRSGSNCCTRKYTHKPSQGGAEQGAGGQARNMKRALPVKDIDYATGLTPPPAVCHAPPPLTQPHWIIPVLFLIVLRMTRLGLLNHRTPVDWAHQILYHMIW